MMKEKIKSMNVVIVGMFICIVILTAVVFVQGNRLQELIESNDLTVAQVSQISEQLKHTNSQMKTITNNEQGDGTLLMLSDEERDLIERVVAAEARGDSPLGMMAVAQVIKNRGDLWYMSYTEVVNAKGQFAKPYQGEISILKLPTPKRCVEP